METRRLSDNVSLGEELFKVYCLTCGKFIGRAAPGNLSVPHCEKCRNEYRLDLREGGTAMRHTRYDVTMKL